MPELSDIKGDALPLLAEIGRLNVIRNTFAHSSLSHTIGGDHPSYVFAKLTFEKDRGAHFHTDTVLNLTQILGAAVRLPFVISDMHDIQRRLMAMPEDGKRHREKVPASVSRQSTLQETGMTPRGIARKLDETASLAVRCNWISSQIPFTSRAWDPIATGLASTAWPWSVISSAHGCWSSSGGASGPPVDPLPVCMRLLGRLFPNSATPRRPRDVGDIRGRTFEGEGHAVPDLLAVARECRERIERASGPSSHIAFQHFPPWGLRRHFRPNR